MGREGRAFSRRRSRMNPAFERKEAIRRPTPLHSRSVCDKTREFFLFSSPPFFFLRNPLSVVARGCPSPLRSLYPLRIISYRMRYNRPRPSKEIFRVLTRRSRSFEDSRSSTVSTCAREFVSDTIARGSLITEARLHPLLRYRGLIAGILNVRKGRVLK